MKNNQLPPSVYKLSQGKFNAIKGRPWVYWVDDSVRFLFSNLPGLGSIAQPRQGMATADNFRFLRFWWEEGIHSIAFYSKNSEEAKQSHKKWFPYMKGGSLRRWYGNQEYILNYFSNGNELKAWADPLYGNSGWSRIIKSTDCYYKEGITWSDLSAIGFGVRYLPPGFIFDVKGSSGFPADEARISTIAIMNSSWMSYSLSLLNPTLSFQVGDISRVPCTIPNEGQRISLEVAVAQAIHFRMRESKASENTFEFQMPYFWNTGINDLANLENKLACVEACLDDEVFTLYGISNNDRETIKTEINWENTDDNQEEETRESPESDEVEIAVTMTNVELATRWISYAVGVVLGNFHPGIPNSLGSTIFHRKDFAIGSLPGPEDKVLEQLICSRECVAYFDEDGGWHLYPKNIEQASCDLALIDGIGVFEKNHPFDLVARVQNALNLLLGETGANEVQIVATGGDLRKFLEKEYFVNYHLKWYHKRPVYWYIQSGKRSYGFVIFHEKITKDTLYLIQREPYLDTKRHAVDLEMQDVLAQVKQSSGSNRKPLEKRLAELRDLAEELVQFAKDLEEITRSGYEPEPDWIDDGVILRMAPLWKVIPLWKSEPKKYWDRLEAGEFDWSHIAMKYWPERVREKCRTNKSFAIAHGHEEWYEGK